MCGVEYRGASSETRTELAAMSSTQSLLPVTLLRTDSAISWTLGQLDSRRRKNSSLKWPMHWMSTPLLCFMTLARASRAISEFWSRSRAEGSPPDDIKDDRYCVSPLMYSKRSMANLLGSSSWKYATGWSPTQFYSALALGNQGSIKINVFLTYTQSRFT